MKKLSLIIAIVALVTTGFYISYFSKSAYSSDAGKLEITFDFKRGVPVEPGMGLASAQYAVWIEDNNGKLIKTVYVTSYTSKGGYLERPESIPVWVSKAKPSQLSDLQLDAISGATIMRDGERKYIWDCRDENGNAVPVGTYRFFVEGSYSWSSKVLFSGTVTVGGNTQNNIPVTADYNDEETHNRDMITNLKATYIAPEPSGSVLKYFIGSTEYTVNGVSNTMDTAPMIHEGRTFMPIRFVTDNIGAEIQWQAADQTVTITQADKTIRLKIGNSNATVNDASVPVDSTNQNVQPFISNGRTMMPLRFIAENLDCTVEWAPEPRMVTVIN
ncbi:MAG: DUF2271 domain-containing protein [Syntrophomonadaceae bacterium]|nr:DUF2271 domain-containing protein [Syntrophomonadaceae bacterium]